MDCHELTSLVRQQATAIAELQRRLTANEDKGKSAQQPSWQLTALGNQRALRVLFIGVLLVSASACCLGAKGVGTATFDNIQIDGTCTGNCGSTPLFTATASTTAGWTPDPSTASLWAANTAYESDAITVTGAAVGDICMVSVYGGTGTGSWKLGTGTGKDFSLSCYVSGGNAVTLMITIGNTDITEGTQNGKLNSASGKWNIAVIDVAVA